MESFHTDSINKLLIKTCAENDSQWYQIPDIPHLGVAEALTGSLTNPEWSYNRVLVVRNCNVIPYASYKVQYEQLPIWHAMLLCLQDNRPRRVLLIDDGATLDKLFKVPPLSIMPHLKPRDGKFYARFEFADLGETPLYTDGNHSRTVVDTELGYINELVRAATHELIREATKMYGNQIRCDASYQIELPSIDLKLFLNFVTVHLLKDGHCVLTQRDEVISV